MAIQTLIDGPDRFELVRDQIAALLVLESAAQQVLADAAGEDPLLWQLRVFTERSRPWGLFIDGPDNETTESTPIVNVWLESADYDKGKSNSVDQFTGAHVYNIDCYGYGKSADNPDGGHIPGDELAALEAQRAARLCRNILMAGTYTYLGLSREVVWSRWVRSMRTFQPQIDNRNALNVQAVRVALEVEFSETSPQVQGVPLQSVHITVKRRETGQIYIEAEFDSGDS